MDFSRGRRRPVSGNLDTSPRAALRSIYATPSRLVPGGFLGGVPADRAPRRPRAPAAARARRAPPRAGRGCGAPARLQGGRPRGGGACRRRFLRPPDRGDRGSGRPAPARLLRGAGRGRRARDGRGHPAQRVRPRPGSPRGGGHPARARAPPPDRGAALGGARRRRAPDAHPREGPRDHQQRRGLGVPRGGVPGRGPAAALPARAERFRPRPLRGVHPAHRRGERGRSRRAHVLGAPARRCLRAAPGLSVPDQPRLRRAGGLPDSVDAGGADDHPAGRGDRRAPAHQLQAPRGRPPRRARGGGRGGHPLPGAVRDAGRLARIAGRGGPGEQPALPVDPDPVRGFRAGVGHRDRVARPDHLRPFVQSC